MATGSKRVWRWQSPVIHGLHAVLGLRAGLGLYALFALWLGCWSALAFATASSPGLSVIENMRFKRLLHGTTETDEVINTVHVTRQDAKGFIWFGGEHGLARYDGHEIKIYQHNPRDPASLTSNAIWDIVFDQRGVMWLATDAGLGRYNPVTDDFTSFRARGFETNSLTGDSVRTLAVDKHNNLIIGTDNGLNILDPSRRNYRTFSHNQDDEYRLPSAAIHALLVDDDGTLWLGTTDSGLIKLTTKPFSYEVFTHKPGDTSSLSHPRVTDIIRDHQGNIWVSTFGGGINRMNPDGKTFTHYQHNPKDPQSLGSNTVWALYEDSLSNLWVATDHGGLALYNKTTDQFSHLTHNPHDASSLSSNSIRSIFEDREGDLWIGAFPIGTNFFDRSSTVFENYSHVPHQPDSLSHATISTLVPSRQGHIWVGTEGGLDAFDPVTKKSRHYAAEPGVPGKLQFNAVLSVAEAPNGDVWVGTWSGGLHRLDTQTGIFEHFSPNPHDSQSLQSQYVWSLLFDDDGALWVGTETAGVSRFNTQTGHWTHYPYADKPGPENVSNPHIWALLKDHAGDIWVGTMHGLNRFQKSTQAFTHYLRESAGNQGLVNNRVTALFEARDNSLWIGTQGGISVLNPDRTAFKHLTQFEGLPAGTIASINQSPDGTLWITTEKGLVSLTEDGHLLQKYQKSHGLIGDNFNRNASYIDATGQLYIGSTEGLSIFNTKPFNQKHSSPKVVFTDFRVFNESITAKDPNAPLQDAIANAPTIRLSYTQRVFAISFAALSYRSANRNQYSYRLVGFDKDWITSGNKHTATYTNLSPGKYVFQVKAANSAGIWSTAPSELAITILPSFWQTWWAWLIYIACALVLAYALFRHKAKQVELKNEKDVNARLVKLDKMKDAFLANTSHELRTPLNGIIGLAEALQDDPQLTSGESHRKLNMIISSGRRLSHLINDILDLSKLADRKIELKRKPVDLHYITDTVIALLLPLVDKKPIKLINDIPTNYQAVLADENRLQQILFNLIGNAIKYSDRGFVRVSAIQDKHTTAVCIKDTGIGIAAEDLPSIFQSFSQLNQGDDREHGGTGLGLAITKQLVTLHGGTLEVISRVGQGTTFIFTIATSQDCAPYTAPNCPLEAPNSVGSAAQAIEQPMQKTGPTATQPEPHTVTSSAGISSLTPSSPTTSSLTTPPTYDNAQNTPPGDLSKTTAAKSTAKKSDIRIKALPNSQEFTILCVDDDPINRMVLSGILKIHQYRVMEADNGETALKLLADNPQIDLVILDVMMPKMTGYEACERLRLTHPITELPVIFLTAKDVETELTQGFLSGGNDFVAKPVKKEELLARIKTQLILLENSRQLKHQLNAKPSAWSAAG